jgi:hypothetical protein
MSEKPYHLCPLKKAALSDTINMIQYDLKIEFSNWILFINKGNRDHR